MNSAAKSAIDLLHGSAAARDVFGQLFMDGPTWDGNVASKAGRDALLTAGLAFHAEGWATLTPLGLRLAIGDFGAGQAKEVRDRGEEARRDATEKQQALLLRALAAIVKNAEGGVISVSLADLTATGACVMEPDAALGMVRFRYVEPEAALEEA